MGKALVRQALQIRHGDVCVIGQRPASVGEGIEIQTCGHVLFPRAKGGALQRGRGSRMTLYPISGNSGNRAVDRLLLWITSIMRPTLSIILPTLNAASGLEATLQSLGTPEDTEIVIADGGSTDGTFALAEARGLKTVAAPKGRGSQLATGVASSSGEALFILHADTLLPPDWSEQVVAFLASPQAATGAAAFCLQFDEDLPGARRVARAANWRSQVFGLPYGDQDWC